MTLEFNSEGKHSFNKFSKLGMWYVLALSVIATIAIAGQILIQRHLHSQVSDSRVVNLAGTQRYKSQWIVKMSMLLYTDMEHKQFPNKIKTLEDLLAQWKRGHEGLQHGDEGLQLPPNDNKRIMEMFADIDPYFQRVYNSASAIVKYKQNAVLDTAGMHASLRTLLDNETIFLQKMDQIVYQFDQEARQKVSRLSTLEYVLLGISVVVILLEIIFVFRPTTIQVNKTIDQLMSSEKNARKLSKEIGALYSSLEKSYEQLSIVNQPVENPRLYAKADRGGNVTFVAESFSSLSGKKSVRESIRLADLIEGMENPDDWMDEVIESVSDGGTWQGELHFEDAAKRDRWVEVIIAPVYHDKGEIEELVMMGSDITKRKAAELNMNKKNRAEIEKKINQQKFRSVLILEGQEEERKRIAMDIHDGIGQMLTSLKFQIESINLKEKERATQKIEEIQQLIREVIKEVRKVTFNLKPTVLGDYGLHAGLNVFIQEIGKLTDVKLIYRTSGETERVPQKTENNIFRIIQEAINNAIKYSGATTITVELRQSENDLIITVKDDGKGFDIKLVEARNMNIDSGRGFFNMYERTEYINGTLNIHSQPGNGTTVTLTVPVRTGVLVEE